jgi:hypothetical protein
MKKILLLSILTIIKYCAFAQSIHYDDETFTYNGNTVYHYGLYWYVDADASAYGPMGYLSGYGGIKFFTAGTYRAVLDANGNFGIGITSPSYKLDVNGVIHSSVTSGNNLILSKSTGASLAFDNGSGTQTAMIEAGSVDNHLEFFTNTATNTGIIERMRITNNGNIGINTTDPKGYMLAVNGSAIATSMTVKLNANWPDYVFKKDYSLPSLSKVKTYIDQNQRLPDMPPEAEVAKDGINLGEMNTLLTKKVEELTLYAIEQEKIQKQQQEDINQLKEAVKQLLKNK